MVTMQIRLAFSGTVQKSIPKEQSGEELEFEGKRNEFAKGTQPHNFFFSDKTGTW